MEGYRRLRKEELVRALVEKTGGDPDAPGSEPDARDLQADESDAEPDAPAGQDEDEDEAPERPRPERSSRGRRSRRGGRRDEGRKDEGGGGGEGRGRSRRGRAEEDDDAPDETEAGEPRTGILDVLPNGSGFMRTDPFAHSSDDVYVSPAQIRRCELRAADQLAGPVRPPRRSERYPSLIRVETVNDQPAEPPAERPSFDDLTAVFPSERLSAPDALGEVPIGKGSRVAIGGPPGAGATRLLRQIAETIADKHSDIELTVVLVGVRPEEVTEWKRDSKFAIAGGGFDRPPEEQGQAAEMAAARAKRAAEQGGHALLVIDSLDALPPGPARRVFSAARNTEEAGSVTVVAATGLSAEPQRVATTRIVLEPAEGGDPAIGAGSAAMRADLLS